MSNREMVRQRVKFAVEHGEAYPAERSPLTRLVYVVIALQLVDIALLLAR